MPDIRLLTKHYKDLLSLYKNPTRALRGQAAPIEEKGLIEEKQLKEKRTELLRLFNDYEWNDAEHQSPLYVKILGLLYEIDDYQGLTPAVEYLILKEADAAMKHLQIVGSASASSRNFKTKLRESETRSLWKARVLCCVGAIETKRKRGLDHDYETLKADLQNLERFVETYLHSGGLVAWTTLATVRAAQARLARQNQKYAYMRRKLLRAVHCLDERAAEIIKRLDELSRKTWNSRPEKVEIQELVDDLVFIRQKLTLSISFNVGLAELQRGFLRSADYACQTANLQFRLHGHLYHKKFNDLVLLSIRRARTSHSDKTMFSSLECELNDKVIRWLEPGNECDNPKLYLYALRELAVIQIHSGDFRAALRTLNKMKAKHPRWSARISNLRARAYYRGWNLSPRKSRKPKLINNALRSSELSFTQAAGLSDGIQSYEGWRDLLTDIENSANKSLIDTIESLVTYGTVQLFLNNPDEAIKSAEVVIALCQNDNPRLLAMGHLVMAEAQTQKKLYAEADEHLANAKILEKQVDHRYVEDRRRAVEHHLPQYFDVTDLELKDAEKDLFGWYIEHRSRKENPNRISLELGVGRKTVIKYLQHLKPRSPYYHLKVLLNKPGKPGRISKKNGKKGRVQGK
ncbi:MAG TPA: hypothetical protein VJ875_13685 [Pyrinomonadaceae bacterium]|nr:hypothetical protein [Pyrinomonadaceae bacterium]